MFFGESLSHGAFSTLSKMDIGSKEAQDEEAARLFAISKTGYCRDQAVSIAHSCVKNKHSAEADVAKGHTCEQTKYSSVILRCHVPLGKHSRRVRRGLSLSGPIQQIGPLQPSVGGAGRCVITIRSANGIVTIRLRGPSEVGAAKDRST